MFNAYTSVQPTIIRTLLLWLFSNLGGTFLLGLGFALTHRLNDSTIAVAAGLLAAIITLPLVPLAVPFFAVLGRVCSGWSRRSMALLGVTLFFILANELLRFMLPFVSLEGLLEMSSPYLAAGLITVFWLYSPGGKTSTTAIWSRRNTHHVEVG
ncbi:hypothetical protein MTX78_17950 [Hymenobacter tibetensis]|uniref:Uncharacterized protein n=1 Tax=Hymenobacter tibetensis TaxID=497967 RepID=A0ABY4CYD9_9BACT|nr:hypothetical protein [Hymenobacter tibetensis]UOG73994.1 hypothetical protein MTX78_17950 [Hymenobacter tibetensis]